MASADETSAALGEPGDQQRPTGRIKRVFSGSRELVRIVYRDPEHVSERLTLYASGRLGEASSEWARAIRSARPDTPRAHIAEELRTQSAQIARIDGAISGTPFFLALVPGYLTYLWQEMRMTLRTAALYDRDPSRLQTAAEMLALRGVHPDIETAQAALETVRGAGTPGRPSERRSLRTWVHSVYLLLVFGGFMWPSAAEPRTGAWARVRAVLSVAVGGAIWITTWVLPVTFMIVMAWGCESHTRQLGRRALVFYDGEEASIGAAIALADQRRDRGSDKRTIARAVALFLSVVIPLAFIALIIHYRNTVGINWLVVALGSLVAVSLVIATAVVSSRR
jgi:hypothetical protein